MKPTVFNIYRFINPLVAFSFLLTNIVFGQVEKPDSITQKSVMIESYIKKIRTMNQFDADNKLVLIKVKMDELGHHYSFKHEYNGIEVVGSEYSIHFSKYNEPLEVNHLAPNLLINTAENFSVKDAQKLAINILIDSEQRKFSSIYPQIKVDQQNIKGRKIISKLSSSGSLKTYYLFEIRMVEPINNIYLVYLDVQSGKVDKIAPASFGSSPGSVTTVYYGLKTVDTKWTGSLTKYKLIDDSRGNGIETKKNRSGLNQFLNDDDNNWDDDYEKRIHASTHWGAQRVWDFYASLGRSGPDGAGMGLDIITNQDFDGSNKNTSAPATNPLEMAFTKPITGDCDPRISLNAIGHEFTHGVCFHEASWSAVNVPDPNSETYALMEGMCDLFGEFAEFYNNGWVDWKYDAESWINISNMRSFYPPGFNGKDAFYYGDNNYINNPDGHYRGGILRHWAYMLSEGSIGQNHLSQDYCVKKIGIDKVRAIIYYVLNNSYLGSSSTYLDLCNATLAVATTFYGSNSDEKAQITTAWRALNVLSTGYTSDISISGHVATGIENYNYNNRVILENFTCNTGSDVTTTSATEIRLLPNFIGNSDCKFHAYIAPGCLGGARITNGNTQEQSSNFLKDNHKATNDPNLDEGFNIYPNPTSENINVVISDEVNDPQILIEIRDTKGNLVYFESKTDTNEIKLNLEKLNRSLYIINIFYNNRNHYQKLMKL